MVLRLLIGSVFIFISIIIIALTSLFIIQKYNVAEIIYQQLDNRVIPHKVNSIGRLEKIKNAGIRSFELDLHIITRDSEVYFEVGHDVEDLNGLRFDHILDQIQSAGFNKIWLDIKNVSDDNIVAMASELIRLDKKYSIKEIALVEMQYTGDDLSLISDAGFHTSYYLPIASIKSLMNANNIDGLKQEAKRIQLQSERQKLSAVSFQEDLYPFVKRYLEPVLQDNIVYHTWDSIKMDTYGLSEILDQRPYYDDTRIKTVLLNYNFNYCMACLTEAFSQ